jgi:3-hydroxyacyl-[acyl-carrier-protein] dehydratase
MKTIDDILLQLPYSKPFRFVDAIDEIDESHIKGSFHLQPELEFYKGHFTHYPITPGVILTEIMAQIGLVCLGIYLLEDTITDTKIPFVMTSSSIDFYKPVYPDETVFVEGEKIYFRFGKLKCKVEMKNDKGETICDGHIEGIQIQK